jgi:hypothetical protein
VLGINPITVFKILASVTAGELLLGKNNLIRVAYDQITILVAKDEIALAKECMRSIAAQDQAQYKQLLEELKSSLSPENFSKIMTGH